jgi:hypothetical protein
MRLEHMSDTEIDSHAFTGGGLNDYERGASCFAEACSHPRLKRRLKHRRQTWMRRPA